MYDLFLYFDGPFHFTEGADSIYHSPAANSAGVYLWTIKQDVDGSHLIHYVGETKNFGKRHREHLINILSLNYGIFEPDDARKGICTFLWRGLWRDRTADGPAKLISEYISLSQCVVRYIKVINIFYAELIIENALRKHIEGCIGWNLRNNHVDCKQLYPDDNHIGTMKEKKNGRLIITANQKIQGLDSIIEY